jgi:hypothetical protein
MEKENFMTQELIFGKKENGKMEKKLCFMSNILKIIFIIIKKMIMT